MDEGIQLLYKIGDWYIEKELTYLRIYGATAAPNLLPKFVPDRLVLREIAYETLLFGFNASLVKEKLRLFITYPMHISPYGLNNYFFARIEAQAIDEYRFLDGRFKRDDPKHLVAQHAAQLGILWPYAHDHWEE